MSEVKEKVGTRAEGQSRHRWMSRASAILLCTSTSALCFLLPAIFLLLAGTAFAQPEQQDPIIPRLPPQNMRFDRLPEELGISTVVDIEQDRHGFLWFADWLGGFRRYDGYTTKRYVHDIDDPNSVSSNRVSVIHEDPSGFLWIGTEDGGLNRFDPLTETFTRFRPDKDIAGNVAGSKDFAASDNDGAAISAILNDESGNLWIGTGGITMAARSEFSEADGLSRFDPETETFVRFRSNLDEETTLSHDWIGALYEDKMGRLWIGSWGLNLFDPQSQTFEHFLPNPDVSEPIDDHPAESGNWVTAILEDAAGRLWVGTVGGGLFEFDNATGSFERRRNDATSDATRLGDALWRILEDPGGGLWLGTGNSGLVWFDPASGREVAYRHDPLDQRSLSGENVTTLFRDRAGVIWATVFNQPPNRFDRSGREFDLLYPVPGDPNSLLLDTYGPLSIAEGPDGTLWTTVGFPARSRAVLNRIDRETGHVIRYFNDPGDPQTYPPGVPFALLVDRSGSVWVAGDWLSRMDPERPGRFVHFKHDPNDPSTRPPGMVRVMMQDSRGKIWLGHQDYGMSRLDDPKNGRFTGFPNQDLDSIGSIFEDHDGILWVGTVDDGLFRLDPETGAYVHFPADRENPKGLSSDRVFGICESPDEPDVLWIAAYTSGLNRLDKKTGEFSRYTSRNTNLADDGVQGVLCDDAGLVWISTDHGLSSFDPVTETFENYDLSDGLQGLAFNSWAYHKSPYSGEFFFGGQGGINAFFPDEIRPNPNPPEVVLTEMRLFDEPVVPGDDSPLDRPIMETTAVELEHMENDITFEFVGLHYSNPEKNEYAYMLEPYQSEWRHIGSERIAAFTNLDPGEYTFRVKAANSDGVWNEAGTSLQITILPPWWRTGWAYAMYVLIFGAGIYLVDQVQRRRLIKAERQRALQKELEQAREIEKAYDELRTTQDRLIQSEKMASLGQLTAGIAHEIKNPLNFVNNFSDLSAEIVDELAEQVEKYRSQIPGELAEEIDDLLGGLKMNVQKINEHGKRADSIVYGMLQHSRTGEAERAEVDINALVDEHLNLAYHGMRARTPDFNATLETDYDKSVGKLEVLPQDLGRVMLNLIGNAFDALKEDGGGWKEDGGAPTVTVSTSKKGSNIEIRISDNGPGIPDDIKSKIFEPFFTTKPTGSGTGLGLSMSYDIITKGHGGSLEVESVEGQGATFIIRLPV